MSVVQLGCEPSAEARRGSIYDLRRDPTVENIAKIRGMLTDPDRDIRATALNTLVGMQVDDAELLALAGIEDEDGFVRSIAAKRLGDLGLIGNAALLVTVLSEDPDPRARRTAAQALELLGGEVAAAGLARGLDDPMKDVRLASVTAIRRVDPTRATAALARLLLEDSIWEVRMQAAGALGLCGDTSVIPVLEAAVTDRNSFVSSAAVAALATLRARAEAQD
jgi:HEAT repeat protein